jgi:threonine/homoserine/homoserine lactone efflux protein
MIAALLLGLATGASFGPVNVEVTKIGLVGRSGEAVPLAFGSWLGDVALMAIATATAVSTGSGIDHRWLRLTAAIAILVVAVASLRRGPSLGTDAGGSITNHPTTVSRGAALSVLSPLGLALWGGVAAAAVAHASGLAAVGTSALVLLGDALWFVTWLVALRAIRSRLSRRAMYPIHVAANCALLVLAAILVAT